MKKYDLAVIGGGFAGVAAALSAACVFGLDKDERQWIISMMKKK